MSAALRVNRVHHPVTALGYGVRLGVWLQGCPLACAGCASQDTWDPGGGGEVPVAELAEVWRAAVRAGADGLTVTGGEPLAQPAGLAAFLRRVRAIGADCGRETDVIVYSGYELDELDETQLGALEHADVAITGRYEIAQPTELIWRGSANQRMILRTPLARRRYERYVDHRPERSPMQVAADGDAVWLIGVPRTGDLARLERRLRDQGLHLQDVSWRRQKP
ncbi:radical SAM protein [Streptosporangiaceae bacterium NEAU-GS5]|nr:radical SAM protein [Streptosporangiaceae bacterium NEAU-GS5]